MIEPPGQNGFTLIELLFALVAGSLLLVALGWVINGLERQLRRSDVLTAANQVEVLTPFLEATLAHAYLPTRDTVFSGTAETVTASVPPPDPLGPVGPIRLTLSVEQEAAGAALVARFQPARADQPLPVAATVPHRLAYGFKAIRFDYLHDGGTASARLPRLITILFTARDGTTLPLGIRPRITMDAGCVFDPISLACRP